MQDTDVAQGDTPAEDLSPFALIWSVAKELLLVLVPALVLALLVNRLVAETPWSSARAWSRC